MNVRQAILKAAHQIRTRPDSFDFNSCETPDCKTPGCALGWIGSFLGVEVAPEDPLIKGRYFDRGLTSVAEKLGLVDEVEFYNRMNWLHQPEAYDMRSWQYNPEVCADLLVCYANTYHCEEPKLALVA